MGAWSTIVDVLMVVLVTVAGWVLAAAGASVKTALDSVAEAAVRQQQWAAELSRELEKTRGVERQELRFESYGELWKTLRPLAIYDDKAIQKQDVEGLAAALSDWYFAVKGGLLLTPQARSFYFALQELLQKAKADPGNWSAERVPEPPDGYEALFASILRNWGASDAAEVLDYFKAGNFNDWQQLAPAKGKQWSEGVEKVADAWGKLNPKEQFVTLQQVGSKLRTALAIDLDSRIR